MNSVKVQDTKLIYVNMLYFHILIMLQKDKFIYLLAEVKNFYRKNLIMLWYVHWHSPISPIASRDKNSMRENQSSVSQVFILGFPTWPEQQGMFFALFLGMWLTTVQQNLVIILLIRLDPCLNRLRYFFLSHLAFYDIPFSSITVPKTLMNRMNRILMNRLTNNPCPMLGTFFRCIFSEILVVLTISFLWWSNMNRYVVIWQPIHYTTVMRQELCILLLPGSWFFCCIHAL